VTRRKFVRLAGSALVMASLPTATKLASAETTPPLQFGGLTPNEKFYLTSYGGSPLIDPASWRLKIKGLVENPLELSYGDIRKLPQIRQRLTLECISNPPDGSAIGNADWVGTKLKPILDRARVHPAAKYVAMRAADNYYTGVPREEIMREENFLPYLMNGQALPIAHGFPVRIFIPGKYGMKQPKWITEIEFLPVEFRGYWEERGWSHSAWRKVNSGFFSPRPADGLLSFFGGSVEHPWPHRLLWMGASGTVWNQARRYFPRRGSELAEGRGLRQSFALHLDHLEISLPKHTVRHRSIARPRDRRKRRIAIARGSAGRRGNQLAGTDDAQRVDLIRMIR
jgi:DMSO/TMAO reductase YedYZ molybdopterin-dependent catalytic subunit